MTLMMTMTVEYDYYHDFVIIYLTKIMNMTITMTMIIFNIGTVTYD